ncbi:MAG: HEPN domain-containing protein [Spirochaetales bacterium]|nr:HEPN domain-containing protein [Spirochaetales bacterium]MBR6201005.1 HEPN domain-containing protein [Spirochaetales bacterium]
MSAETLFENWLEFAKDDLETAEILTSHYPIKANIICWHCQQCVEKSLKAVLVKQETIPEKTHDLKRLCQLCSEYNPEFMEFMQSCAYLSVYAVVVRYPNEIDLSEEDAATAIKYTKEIYEYVEKMLYSSEEEIPKEDMKEI